MPKGRSSNEDADYAIDQVVANAEQVANQAVLIANAGPPDHEMNDDMSEGARDTSRSSSPQDDRGSSVQEPGAWNKRTFASGSRYADAHGSPPPSGSCRDSDSPPPLADSSGSDKEPCEEDAEAVANWKSRKQRQVARSTPSAELIAEAAEYIAEYVAEALAPPPLPPPAESPSPAGEPQAEPGCASDLSMMD